MRHLVAAGMLFGIVLTACAAPNSYERFLENGLPKAAFQMNCPEAEIKSKELSLGSVGVEGCGQRFVYVHAGYAGWVVDTESKEGTKDSK